MQCKDVIPRLRELGDGPCEHLPTGGVEFQTHQQPAPAGAFRFDPKRGPARHLFHALVSCINCCHFLRADLSWVHCLSRSRSRSLPSFTRRFSPYNCLLHYTPPSQHLSVALVLAPKKLVASTPFTPQCSIPQQPLPFQLQLDLPLQLWSRLRSI